MWLRLLGKWRSGGGGMLCFFSKVSIETRIIEIWRLIEMWAGERVRIVPCSLIKPMKMIHRPLGLMVQKSRRSRKSQKARKKRIQMMGQLMKMLELARSR